MSRPNWTIYQYRVEFHPEIEMKRWRYQMLKEHQQEILKSQYTFDGMGLYMLHRLENEETEVYSAHPAQPDEKVRITVKLTNELPPSSPVAIHIYNVLFRNGLKALNMQQVGRHYFSFEHRIPVPQHKIEVLPGYTTSILHYENQVLLQLDVTHKILSQETVLNVMYDLYARVGQDVFHDMCAKKLIGQIVMTRYNNRTYRISDISWDEHPTDTFQTRDGPITYVDYYKRHYGIDDAMDMDQPLLIIKPKASDIRRGMSEDIKLLPQFCVLTGLSDEVRADFNVMRDLHVHTRIGPSDRVQRYKKFISDLSSNPKVNESFSSWDLRFDNDCLKVPARQLNKVEIQMIDSRKKERVFLQYDQKVCDWTNDMRGKTILKAVVLQYWTIVCPQRNRGQMEDFKRTLNQVCGPLGVRMGEPNVVTLENDRESTYLKRIKENLGPQDQLVVVVLSNNNKSRYDAIKKHLCLENPVPSQCMTVKTLSRQKQLMSITTKIAIQMQCKLGGEIWAAKLPPIAKPYMVVGIDTYHDSSQKGKSACGFVASMNQSTTRYFSDVCFQTAHIELCNGLEIFMTAALKNFHEINNVLPEFIFVYRDGVGDGQLEAVHQTEVQKILTCFKNQGTDYNPRLAFIVVKKRINQRFFANGGGRGLDNPPPGTVIDQEVTRPEWYDFFLISQSVRQGTVSPTHYNIIYDTINWGPDKMQIWTYMQTHLYYNWPGTIRVPAPCQYAHKLAFLVGQSLHKSPSKALAHTLYYL
jgi:aubergine-like protein